MLEYLEKLQKEDMEQLIKKRETQKAVMKDVAVANEVNSLCLSLSHTCTLVLDQDVNHYSLSDDCKSIEPNVMEN